MNNLENVLKVNKDQIEHAHSLHKKYIVIDGHGGNSAYGIWTEDMAKKANEMIDVGGFSWTNIRSAVAPMRAMALRKYEKVREECFDMLRKTGLLGAICATLGARDDLSTALSRISNTMAIYRIPQFRDLFIWATSANDFLRAKREGKWAWLYHSSNSLILDMEIDNVDLFYNLGLRVMQLSYNLRNYASVGCTELDEKVSGLSYWGIRVVERMNDIGMLIDCAHGGTKSTLDMAEYSKDPVIITHGGCRGVYRHDRNHEDEAIKAVAEKGGVLGIYVVPAYIAKGKGNLTDFLNHLDYAIKLVGVDHVAIGTDDYVRSRFPDRLGELANAQRAMSWKEMPMSIFWSGFRDEHGSNRMWYPIPDEDPMSWVNWPNLTVGLVSRGYSDQEIKKILGENWLRIFTRVLS